MAPPITDGVGMEAEEPISGSVQRPLLVSPAAGGGVCIACGSEAFDALTSQGTRRVVVVVVFTVLHNLRHLF